MSYYTLRNSLIREIIKILEQYQGQQTYNIADRQAIEQQINDFLFKKRYSNQIFNYHVLIDLKNYPNYNCGFQITIKTKTNSIQQNFDEFVLFVLPNKFEAKCVNDTINEDPKEAYKRAMSIL